MNISNKPPVKCNVVSSPVLMPPPKKVPPFPSQIKLVRKESDPDFFAARPKDNSGTIREKERIGGKNSVGVNIKPVVTKDQLRCYVPKEDVPCSVTTNVTNTDEYTKQFVKKQISKKIFRKAEKRVNMTVTPKRKDEGYALQERSSLTPKKFKLNEKHFSEKNMNVSDIDIDTLDRPIRCSTPTPSISGSTILAGHLDYTIDEMDTTLDRNEDNEDPLSDDDDDFFKKFINVPDRKHDNGGRKAEESGGGSVENIDKNKNTLCTEWIKNESGVCTNNGDEPPSLYAPSAALSDSLLDITSVSRNIKPVAVKSTQKYSNSGMGIKNENKHSNTTFM